MTRYDYDTNGNLAKITDAVNNATNYTYDLFDRLDKTTYANLTFNDYDYDKNSNLIKNTTPSTKPIDYVYDALNRLTAKNFPQTPTLNQTYGYDFGSRMTSANNAASEVNFGYDKLNRVSSTTQKVNSTNRVLTYQYDKMGNRTQLIYPSGETIDYTYDANDRLDIVKRGGINFLDYNYDPLDRRTQKSFLGATLPIATYSYDIANQLTGVTNKLVNNSIISVYAYPQYDAVGNRKQMSRTYQTNPAQITDYTYNNVYELTATSGAQTNSYAYEKLGNRTTTNGTNYTKNNLNQYTQVGPTNYSYDTNGNLTDNGITAYTFDEENRLTSFDGPGSSNDTTYEYDAFHRRVKKNVNGTITYYLYDGDQIIAEYASNGSLIAEYVTSNNIDEILTMSRNSNVYYYHYDGLGSVTEVTNSAGSISENYTYDAFGMPSVTSSAIANPYRFTGREFDEESGIYHYRARAYDPSIGRFLQRDPIGYYDSLNLYQFVDSVGKPLLSNPSDFTNAYNFVGNNPVNYTDPLGLYKYSTTNTGIAFLHESNPFNTDGAFFQQATSMGSFFGGDLSGAAATSGQSIIEQTNTPCTDSGWQKAYTGAQITAGIAALTAGSLIAIEAGTAIRIEVHGTHGGRVLPHLQGIKGPGWGKTLWRFPPH